MCCWSDSDDIRMEIFQLDLVEAEEDGQVSQRTRSERKSLQISIRRHKGDGADDRCCQIETHKSQRQHRPTCHAISVLLREDLW